MPSSTASVTPRQQALLARSAALREGLRRDAAVLGTPLAVADLGLEGLRWASRHRLGLAAGAAALALAKPRRTLRWLGRGWWVWRLARRAAPVLMAAWAVAGRRG